MNGDNLLDLGPEAANSPIPTGVAVAAIALNFAMKYHDINTVQDGTLYQQYKLEGKNFEALHLGAVFDTAKQIEAHLMSGANRLSDMVFESLIEGLSEEVAPQQTGQSGAETGADPSSATL